MRFAAWQLQACGSINAHVQQAHAYPAACNRPSRLGGWHERDPLQLAVEQNDVRPPIGHKVSYTEH